MSFQVAHLLYERLRTVIKGRDPVLELVIYALFADGHVLLEDYPGSGKTTLAKTLGEAIADDRPNREESIIKAFRRIQFTPDLLPADITGTMVFEPATGLFRFRPGPIFAHVVLADEINRTSPKVQAAMLEAMAEKQVTVDNESRPLDDLFLVIATQNPLDVLGTYPLPTPQLDRFLFKIRMSHIAPEAELSVLRDAQSSSAYRPESPVVRRSEILAARQAIREGVFIHELIRQALVDIANRLRADKRVMQGVSTRALLLGLSAMQVRAMWHNRNYVSSEDIEALLPFVFGHRVELLAGTGTVHAVIDEAIRPSLEMLANASMRPANF